MDQRLRNFLLIIITVSILVSLGVARRRIQAEISNNTIEIVLGYDDVKKLSSLDGIPPSLLLRRLREFGITSIALAEDTLDSLEKDGLLTWTSGGGLLALNRIAYITNSELRDLIKREEIKTKNYYIIFRDGTVKKKIADELKLLLGKDQVKSVGTNVLEVVDDEEDLFFLPVGIRDETYKWLRERGFRVIPRLKGSRRLVGYKINLKLNLEKIAALDDIIIFDEDEVVGYPYDISVTANELKGRSIKFGFIELSEQLGGSDLLSLMEKDVVRVHSIPSDEIEIMDEEEASLRMVRAVRERSIRLLYLRPFLSPLKGRRVVETNLHYIDRVINQLNRAGFNIGHVSGMKDVKVRYLEVVLISLGVVAYLLFLLSSFYNLSISASLLILLFTALVAFFLRSEALLLAYRKILALSSAVILPSYAIISQFRNVELKSKSVVLKALSMTIAVFFISAIGALFIVGLLSDTSFMLGAEQFSGVKIAFILPILIVALYFFLSADRQDKKETLKEILNTKVTITHLLLGLFILSFITLILLRSGNFGITAPPIERSLRDALENLLIVRPRTKEVLVGYPFIILSAVYYLSGRRNWLPLLSCLAVIAPISLVNTFCHIHSAILISILRSIYGLGFGIVIGFLYLKVYDILKNYL